MTTETKGYTISGVAGRIRDLESKTNGAYYVGLCWLAMARDSGKGAKKRLEDKVFGVEKGVKVTSTFRNAWRIADKAFAEGFHKGHREKVATMGLDDALKFAMDSLEAHKTALGVTSMGQYEEFCKYASKEDMPAPTPEETTEQPVTTEEPEAKEEATDKTGSERSPLEHFEAVMLTLSPEELIEAAKMLNARIADMQQTEEIRKAA
ncbi:hypothetical protein BSQ44_24375 [Aquibium oceanicum]|uniref:Uncharacterized protein n=2 Tax=Aquibium oceanicum TaxID=1670800 RepID=A0A1L3SXP1_9HYPH|nr:hypothetical protein [Aquibium oceanicum]APH74158.1 hypothetical protein BSQ44_24375 [Aquibium oceanicum]